MTKRERWEEIWRTHPPTGVSWYAPHLAESLRLIREVARPDAGIIDVGGGASTLVDDLLAHGYMQLTVLDVSESALAASRARLGDRAALVEWVRADVTTVTLREASFEVWHDRAVFHFLTAQAERQAYVRALEHSVKPHGWVVIGTFALTGPSRCSGLDVVRYDASGLQRALGGRFLLSAAAEQTHVTPDGRQQRFTMCRLQRSS
jgi:2-polyprenyl-3-methyl-5-hydroxy-6-metoxy-1,4-benzoquinol methylase